MYLDSKLEFLEHLENIHAKVNKSIALLRKLQTILPRPRLLTIYKAFIRPHVGYGDTIYDQTYNYSFHQKMESIQHNASFAITGAIRGTSSGTFYRELGLESLQQRRWYRKLRSFLKIIKEKSPIFSILLLKTILIIEQEILTTSQNLNYKTQLPQEFFFFHRYC